MFDTESVFNVLAADDTERRVASRRALALAHTRVENHLGQFLRQAQSEEEFEARLAACQEEFVGHVATAAQEHSYDKPEYIAQSLRDHYAREAMVKEAPGKEHMKGVGPKRNRQYEHIKEQLEDSGKDEERAKEEAARTVNKTRRKHHELKDAGAMMTPSPAMPPQQPNLLEPQLQQEMQQNQPPQGPPLPASPQALQQMPGQPAQIPPALDPNQLPGQPPQQQQPQQPQPFLGSTRQWVVRPLAGFNSPASPWDAVQEIPPNQRGDEGAWMPGEQPDAGRHYPAQTLDWGQGPEVWPESWEGPSIHQPRGEIVAPNFTHGPNDPVMQEVQQAPRRMGSEDMVTCPECGGDGKTANRKQCPKCHGAGQVANFGPSIIDSSVHTAESGNAELGGPEPKMDKRLWTPKNVGDPEPDSKYYPNREKDILVPMKATNEEELKEIGEQTTERKELPTSTNFDDAGYAKPNMEQAPHTKTFNGDGQVDPVTRETIS